MEFAFLDESGDRGGKGSKYFILCLMLTNEVKKITKIIRKTKTLLLRKHRCAKWLNQNGGEIKFHKFPDKHILENALKDLSKLDIHVNSLILRKDGLDIKNEFKCTILTALFEHILKNKNEKPRKILADTDFINKEKFNYFALREYKKEPFEIANKEIGTIEKRVRLTLEFASINKEIYNKSLGEEKVIAIKVEHINSKLCEPLQALDLIAGSIFTKFENNNTEFTDIFENAKGKIRINGIILKSEK